jgi:hypothetical protein
MKPLLFILFLLIAGSIHAQIHTGGGGDGFSLQRYAQQTDTLLFTGGEGDGFNKLAYSQVTQNTLFTGGDGDGFFKGVFAQKTDTALFTGGDGDGFSKLAFAQSTDTALFTGGDGDGFSRVAYTQKTDTTLFTGGIGDGYSFTQIPIVPLPLNWLAFKGRRVDKVHELEWKVASTETGDAFQLERSPTGTQFNALYNNRVETASASETSFRYVDETPLTGDNFYRVRQTDRSGRVSYSSTVLLRNLHHNRSLVLFPNPAATHIQLRIEGNLSEKPIAVRVYNATGQLLSQFRLEAGTPQYDLDIAGWAAGSYFLHVIADGNASVIPFLKAGQ